MNLAQQVELVRSLLEEEVCVAIKGLDTKGALGWNYIEFFYREFWELVEPKVMAMLEEFRQGGIWRKLIDHICSPC